MEVLVKSNKILHVLEVKNLWVETSKFPILRDINFKSYKGKIKVIIGESGAGKSTLGFFLAGILKNELKARGKVLLDGMEVFPPFSKEWKGKKAGIIFQDPYSFFDPRERIFNSIKEGLLYHFHLKEKEAEEITESWLTRVKFPEKYRRNFPHQLSGGMLQRASIASVLSLNPEIVIADEPTSALDPPLRRGITEIFREIARERYIIYITHFIDEALEIGDDFLVLYGGMVMEETDIDFIHPYSKLLTSSILKKGEPIKPSVGYSPHPSNLPPGCPFMERCELKSKECKKIPPLTRHGKTLLRCWNVP